MDTLVAALDRGETMRDPAALRRWLRKIATNEALGRQRRFRRVTWLQVMPDSPGFRPRCDRTRRVDPGPRRAADPLAAAVVLHGSRGRRGDGHEPEHRGAAIEEVAERDAILDSIRIEPSGS